MEMSRQRIRTGVLESSSIPCSHCGGSGFVRATSSVALHILRSIEEALIKSATHNLVLRTRTEVALYILNQKRAHLRELELRFGVTITVAAEGPSARSLFDAALTRGISSLDAPPAPLVALFRQLDRVPEWVDWERLELGARTYQRVGPATLLILSAWSLMNGYHCGPAVKPLAFTRQLEAMAPRRLAETGRFVTEVAQASPRHASTPSRTANAAITRPATASAHHHPNALLSTSPSSTAAER